MALIYFTVLFFLNHLALINVCFNEIWYHYQQQKANIICRINTVKVKISKTEGVWLHSLRCPWRLETELGSAFYHNTQRCHVPSTIHSSQLLGPACRGMSGSVETIGLLPFSCLTWGKHLRSERTLPWTVRQDEKVNFMKSIRKN